MQDNKVKYFFSEAIERRQWVILLSILTLAVIGFRLFQMSFSPIDNTQSRNVEVLFKKEKTFSSTPRRSIVDREGRLLAGNVDIYDIDINPSRFNEDDFLAFATAFNWSNKERKKYKKRWIIRKELNRKNIPYIKKVLMPSLNKLEVSYANLQKKILTSNTHDSINATNNKNNPIGEEGEIDPQNQCRQKVLKNYMRCRYIVVHKREKRVYPTSQISAPLVGLVSNEGNGQSGLEFQYNKFLKSDLVKELQERNARGRLIAIRVNNNNSIIPKTPIKSSLETTIDNKLQKIAYKHLKQTINKVSALSGSVIIVSAKNAEILANVTYPSFNPNTRKGLTLEKLRSAPLMNGFEPGSTIKPLVLAKLFSDTDLKETDAVEVDKGMWQSGTNKDTIICDDSGCGYGRDNFISVRDVITRSSNVGISKLTDRYLTPIELRRYFEELGFGVRTEVNYPGESEGSTNNSLHRIDMLRHSFGYGFRITSAQLASAYQALANNGQRITLTQRKISYKQKVHNQIFSSKTSKRILSILEAVADNDGTARLARIPGYRLGGKTGTAQTWIPGHKDKDTNKWVAGHYDKSRLRVLFVGIAPIDNPDMVAVVLIESPQSHESGSKLAAPLFKRIMQEALLAHNILPKPNQYIQ